MLRESSLHAATALHLRRAVAMSVGRGAKTVKKLGVTLLLLFALPGWAGELGVSWNAVDYPHPITYQVYRNGIATGPQTAATSTVLTDALDDCTVATYAVTAIGATPGGPLESAMSLPVTSMARPTLVSIVFNAAGVHRITGDNFPADTQVEVDGVPATGVNRIDCQTVEIPTTAGTPTTVKVINPAGPLSVTWTLPPPVSPVGVGVF